MPWDYEDFSSLYDDDDDRYEEDYYDEVSISLDSDEFADDPIETTE